MRLFYTDYDDQCRSQVMLGSPTRIVLHVGCSIAQSTENKNEADLGLPVATIIVAQSRECSAEYKNLECVQHRYPHGQPNAHAA